MTENEEESEREESVQETREDDPDFSSEDDNTTLVITQVPSMILRMEDNTTGLIVNDKSGFIVQDNENKKVKKEASSWFMWPIDKIFGKKDINADEENVIPMSAKKESRIKSEEEVAGTSTSVKKKIRFDLISGFLPSVDKEFDFLNSFTPTNNSPDIFSFMENKMHVLMNRRAFASGSFGAVYSGTTKKEGKEVKLAIKGMKMQSVNDFDSVKKGQCGG
jgi:hypothetical protein